MADVIEPTGAMVDAALQAWWSRNSRGAKQGTMRDALRAALNHPDARGLFGAPTIPAPGGATVLVRVPVLVAPSGEWVAWTKSGDDGEGREHARWYMSDAPFFTTHYLTATLPLPQPVDIAATVESGE